MVENVPWVDFREVKRAAQFEPVLARYNLHLQLKGADLVGPCPFHQDKKPSFRVSVDKKAFHCFGCGAKGNILDFVARMEQATVRDAALMLQEWFGIDGQRPLTPRKSAEGGNAKRAMAVPRSTKGEEREDVAANTPLSFLLKGVDPGHAYLAQRGISRGTAEYFGAGYFPGKGSMAGRVVIPIHNASGELVAYAGRTIDQTEPRYKLPNGFHKALVLFNLHRVLRAEQDVDTVRQVIVVEGFFDAMKVVQAGFSNVVALMGTTLSEPQARLLAPFREVVLMLDGDDAGRHASNEIAGRLARMHFVRIVDVDGEADELGADQIQELLGKL